MADESSDRMTVVLLAILVEGGLIVLAWGLGWLLGVPPLQNFAWEWRGALWGLAGTVPMILLFLALMRWPVGPLGRLKRFSEEVLRPLLSPCSVADLAGIALLAGLGEEMLFRAVLQGAFTRWSGPWVALALASALFGLLHAVTVSYAVLAALMGAYLGWVWRATDNLLVPVVMHGLYDFFALLYLLRGPGGGEKDLTAESAENAETRQEKKG